MSELRGHFRCVRKTLKVLIMSSVLCCEGIIINAERYEVTNTADIVMSRAQGSSPTIRMCCDAYVSFSCGCPLHEDITSQVH